MESEIWQKRRGEEKLSGSASGESVLFGVITRNIQGFFDLGFENSLSIAVGDIPRSQAPSGDFPPKV